MHSDRKLQFRIALLNVVIFISLAFLLTIIMSTNIKAAEYLGRIGSNPFCSDCTANPFAPISNPFNPNSPRNPFGPYGNPLSPYSANNPFATDTPEVYGTADE
jgi:hypothetical protein